MFIVNQPRLEPADPDREAGAAVPACSCPAVPAASVLIRHDHARRLSGTRRASLRRDYGPEGADAGFGMHEHPPCRNGGPMQGLGARAPIAAQCIDSATVSRAPV